MKTSDFVHQIDQDRVVAAIAHAEARSRGEVRVHITDREIEDPQAAASEQFAKLGMGATAERNGVLIYVAPATHSFAVIGDQGIHAHCGPEFWQDVASAMVAEFKAGRFTEGIVAAVTRAGDALARHFPRTAAADANELSDEVTRD